MTNECVILVPAGQPIVPGCEEALNELQRRGYTVWRVSGFAAIDQCRNQMATDALSQGFHETMWIDSDIVFHPDSVETLRRHRLPITCGIYPKKAQRELAIHALPDTKEIVFGAGAGLMEILYAATGFLHVRREVYENVQRQLALPICNASFGTPIVPFFLPQIVNSETAPWYLAEDYAFCHRARDCGYAIMADPSIRLHHVGAYGYSWEDVGGSFQRSSAYRFRLT